MSGIVKDSVIYGISTLFQRGVQILLTPLYFATLADGQTGLLDILVGFSLISVCIFSLNITNGLAREMADESSPIKGTHTPSALWFSLLTCLFGALCIVVFPSCSRFLFSGYQSTFHILLCVGILIISNQILDIVTNHFRWSLQARCFLLVVVVQSAVLITSSIVILKFYKWGLIGAIAAFVIANLLASAVGICISPKSFLKKPNLEALHSMLRFSMPLVPAAVVTALAAYMPRLIVNHQASNDQLDALVVAMKSSALLSPIYAAVSQSLVPHVYRSVEAEETKPMIAKFFEQFLGLCCLLISCLVAISPWLNHLLSNGKHPASSQYVGVLAVGLLIPQLGVFFLGAWIKRKTWIISVISIGSAILGIIASVFAVPYFGLWGACLVPMTTAFLALLATAVFSQKLYHVPFRWSSIALYGLILNGVILASAFFPVILDYNGIGFRMLFLVVVLFALYFCGWRYRYQDNTVK